MGEGCGGGPGRAGAAGKGSWAADGCGRQPMSSDEREEILADGSKGACQRLGDGCRFRRRTREDDARGPTSRKESALGPIDDNGMSHPRSLPFATAYSSSDSAPLALRSASCESCDARDGGSWAGRMAATEACMAEALVECGHLALSSVP